MKVGTTNLQNNFFLSSLKPFFIFNGGVQSSKKILLNF